VIKNCNVVDDNGDHNDDNDDDGDHNDDNDDNGDHNDDNDDDGDHNDDNDDDDIIIRMHSISRLYVILIISYNESHYFLLYYL
jgi:hypothetical protein